MDLELLKAIPGYKAILKSVLKSQIQLLVEQLCEQAGEESIILTASISDGTLSHLGSNMGKGFFEGRDEIKSQFLGYCLKGHHNRQVPQQRMSFQQDLAVDTCTYEHSPSASKRQRFQHISGNFISHGFEKDSRQKLSHATSYIGSNRRKVSPKKTPEYPPAVNTTPSTTLTIVSLSASSAIPVPTLGDHSGPAKVKVEINDIQNDQIPNLEIGNSTLNSSETIHSSDNLTPTRTIASNSDPVVEENLEVSNKLVAPSLVNVKEECDEEEDLEITGVEAPDGATRGFGDWGDNISGELGCPSEILGDDTLDQSGNQIMCQATTTQTVQEDDIKKFECRYCAKLFNCQSYLDRHILQHTGEKPYRCKHCLRRFTRQTTVDKHVVLIHGLMNFQCEKCAEQFASRKEFTLHVELCLGIRKTRI